MTSRQTIFSETRPQWGPIAAFYDRRDEDGSTLRTMETSQPKRADLLTNKASKPIASQRNAALKRILSHAASGSFKQKPVLTNGLSTKTGQAIAWPAVFDGSLEGIPVRASRDQTPQAKAFGRIPKNCPPGSFLDGIPPHRFESPQPDKKPKQARQSPDLQYSMVAWRGFEPPISALRGRRPKPLDDQAMRALIKQLD